MVGDAERARAQAKRRAEAHLGNEDWVRRGLKMHYCGARSLTVERNGAPYATLLSQRGDWVLEPGRYILVSAAGYKTSLVRGTTSVTTGSLLST